MSDFNYDSIPLSYFPLFIERFGGREKFQGLTTTDVCNKFVKPETAAKGECFLDQLRSEKFNGIGTATVFISHAWAYKFLEVYDALVSHFKNEPGVIVWFDLFTNNQHKAVNYPFEWWCNTFKSAIQRIGRVVMVMAPWKNPIPLGRAWCLFELYCCADSESRFEVAMSDSEKSIFLQSMNSQVGIEDLAKLKAAIDTRASQSYNPEDMKKIHLVVASSSQGFNGINKMVYDQLLHWVVDSFNNFYEDQLTELGEDDPNTLSAMYNLSVLYSEAMHLEESLALCVECMEKRNKLFGEKSTEVIDCLYNISRIYDRMGFYDRSVKYTEEVYEIRKQTLHGDDQDLASSTYAMALGVLGKKDSQLVIPKLLECMKYPNNTNYHLCMTNLAMLYLQDKNYSEATHWLEKYFDTIPEGLKQLPDRRTLTNMLNLAKVYLICNDKKKAEIVLNDCYDKGVAMKWNNQFLKEIESLLVEAQKG